MEGRFCQEWDISERPDKGFKGGPGKIPMIETATLLLIQLRFKGCLSAPPLPPSITS